MPLIVILLAQYWKPLALVALIAAAVGYRAILIHQRDEARARVGQLSAETASLRSANQALGSSVDRQNQAVAQLTTRADAAENSMTASEQAAARTAATEENNAERQQQALIAAPIDAGAGCDGAIRWGNAQAGGLSSW